MNTQNVIIANGRNPTHKYINMTITLNLLMNMCYNIPPKYSEGFIFRQFHVRKFGFTSDFQKHFLTIVHSFHGIDYRKYV